jgi:enoyl-CoA hydratase
MSSPQYLLYEVKDNVAVITFNRPQALNAWNEGLTMELEEALHRADSDAAVRVVVLTGAGRAYNVGGDIKEFEKADTAWIERFNRRVIRTFRFMEQMRKPILAAVNGHANIESVQACDLVLAAEDAKFGLPEINIGVCPGAGITIRLPRWMSRYQAKELLFFGDWIGATEAQRLGFVNRVVPNERLMEEAMAWAAKLAKRAPLALGAIKACVNVGAELDLDRGADFQLLESSRLFYSEDLKEGLRAFLEKREPRYQGR